nr:MAG TPA: hypothetical protein [Bacteriophage sp.]
MSRRAICATSAGHNRRTGAAWLVSFDYRDGSYWHEPQGNLRHIRRPYASRSIEPNLVPAGTH